jgi:hypothetical protein
MRTVSAVVLGCVATVAFAQTFQWPSLPRDGFMVGRAATKADVDAGRAVFVAAQGGQNIGVPMAIDIPQYAYFLDKGKRSPAIVLQAEEAQGQKLIGARLLNGTYVAGFAADFELLGKVAPAHRAP